MARPNSQLLDKFKENPSIGIFSFIVSLVNGFVSVLVVGTSCIITTVSMIWEIRGQHMELQLSKRRVTVTILLFALVFGICNVPYIFDNTTVTHAVLTKKWDFYESLYKFDYLWYFGSVIHTLLRAANSAVNPLLYHWRMPRLREHTLSGVKRVFRRCDGETDPAGKRRPYVVQNSAAGPYVARHTLHTTPVAESNL
jgi:hypothetical protein